MKKILFDKKAGLLIRVLRKEKGLTLKELYKFDTDQEIYTKRHASRLETGENEPHYAILMQLLSVLGITYDEFLFRLYGADIQAFNNEFAMIWDLNFGNQYQEMETALQKLKAMDCCDMAIPHIAQAVFLTEGLISYMLHNDPAKGIDTLHKALRLTTPKTIFSGSEINDKNISIGGFSLNEYRIIRTIANALDEAGQRKRAIKITQAMCISLERVNTDYTIRRKQLPAAYFNLSNMLIYEGYIDEALVVVEKGIAFSKRTKEFIVLDLLYYNKAKALHLLGDTHQAEMLFRKSYALSVEFGNNAVSEFTKKMLADKYCIHV